MIIGKVEIENALAYYGFDGIDKDSLFHCIDTVKDNVNVENVINQMYFAPYETLEALYGKYSKELMFWEGVPASVPFIVFLLGASEHIKSCKKYGFDDNQIAIQKEKIRECGEIYLNSGNTTALAWSANFVRGKLLQIGRLQFQYLCGDKDNATVHIHIPGGAPLDNGLVTKAISSSGHYLNKYYGITNACFKCDSWLLSPELQAYLSPSSNIHRFSDMFDVESGEDALRDIRWNLYHTTDNFAPLEQSTSLQIAVKKAIDSGVRFHNGIGTLKVEYAPSFN